MRIKVVRLLGCLLSFLILFTTAGCGGIVRQVLNAAGEDVGNALTDEQVVKLTFGAVLSTRNSMNYRTLFGLSSVYLDAMKESIEGSWSITDRDSALETLNWLRDEGHHLSDSDEYYGYDEIYRIIAGKQAASEDEIQQFAVELAGYKDICLGFISDYGYTEEELNAVNTVSAWDYDRLVTLARWCAGLGYITEDEAWEYIDAAVAMARVDYDNWRAYFAGVLFGRAIWSEDGAFVTEDREIARKLLMDKNSVYNTVNY